MLRLLILTGFKGGWRSHWWTMTAGFLVGLASTGTLRAQPEPMHPILTISGSGSGAGAITNIAESYYTNSFIPHSPPRNAAQGFAPTVVPGDTGWSWSASTPNQITSTPSGTVFPSTNAAYPIQTQAVTVFLTTATNNLTRTVNAIYYNAAGSTTTKSMVFNWIDYNKLNQLHSDLDSLAPAYLNSGGTPATRNDNYARRIAIALLDWARWHPSYYLTAINSPELVNVTTNYLMTTGGFGLQRASDHNGLAHEWNETELKAFDAIYSSAVLSNLNAEMGFNVRDYIATNLFFDEGDFLVTHVPVDIAIQSNLSGPYAVLPKVARVLNRPDYIVWMDAYLDATVRQKIRRDGTLAEGLGYSIGYLNANQDAAQNTQDYFLTRAATNSQLLAISNRAVIYNAMFTYGQGQWNAVSLPSGQLPSFGDTPFNNYFAAHGNGNSALLPAYGHVAMGAGSGSQAVQVNQNFPGDHNHMRADITAFVLWAFNHPYLENIRYYNPTPGRMFGEQMLSHNAVTINRVNETPYPDTDTYGNGDLTLYEPGNTGLALTEIDGQRGYSGKASRYQRLLFLNSVDLAKPYVVDVMRVTGGTNHDYTFHGAIRWDQNWQCSFPLVTNSNPYPMLEGETWFEPATSFSGFPYYGFWRNVSSNAAPASNFFITYRDTNRLIARDLRLWMTDEGAPTVYLGMTPNPGRDNTVPADFYGYWRPSAIIRHRIPSGTLSSLFVSVIEPFNTGVSNLVSVTRLPMSGATNESVGLRIVFADGRTDTYIVNLCNPLIAGAAGGAATVATDNGQYSLTGRVGLQVDRPKGSSRVWTMNATDFQYSGGRLTTSTNTYFSGWMAGATRRIKGAAHDAFTTASPLPTGTVLRNKYLSLTHGALTNGITGVSEMFTIDQVIFSNGLYHICFTNDHYLEITNGTNSAEQVAPLRAFTTSNSFEIALSASAQRIFSISDQTIPLGGSSGALDFTYGDLGSTAGSSLAVGATASNPALIPAAGLVLGGSGTARTLTVTPAAGQTGSSSVTVSVTDGVWTNSCTFNVVVASPSGPSVWTGGSAAGSYWSDAANWNDSAIAPNQSLFFDGSVRLNTTNDTAAGAVYSNLLFTAGAGPFTLNGNPITLAGNLTNCSSSLQTINLGLSFRTSVVLDGGSGGFILGGGLTNALGARSYTTLTLAGLGILTNRLDTLFNPGGTNVITLNSAGAKWTLMDNAASAATTVPWIWAINSGTFNFGAANSAPVVTLASAQGLPADPIIGSGSGNVATFNLVNGILTNTARLGTGLSAGTAIINQSGGLWVVNAQFQNANAVNPGKGTINVNGGTLHVAGGTLFVASRGTGTLNVSGTGQVLCTTLDISRAASGGGSRGTVNLDGGTLALNYISTATANVGLTNGSETATLNFNGGRLLARQDHAAFITQSGYGGAAAGSNIVLNLVVKAGGAVIDTAGFAVTSLRPLLHDSALGGTADGGLTKLGAGTLTLTNGHTYTGPTVVSAGTLALTGSGSLANSANLVLNTGATLDVCGRTDGRLTLVSGQTLSGNGTVNGQLWVNAGATLAPGQSLGVLTVSSNATLQGTTVMALNQSMLTNDVLQVNGALAYGGTLSLTNLAGTLASGDSFNLFKAAGYSGGFTNILPAIPGLNLAWNTNSLTNGALSIVSKPNQAPVLAPLTDRTVGSGSTLWVTNVASDADFPSNRLTFALVNAPLGVVLDSVSGVLSWTPTEVQAPSTNLIMVRVFDDGVPNLSATQVFMVLVRDATPPVIAWSFTNLNLWVSGTNCSVEMPDLTGTNYLLASDHNGLTVIQSVGTNAWLVLGTNLVVLAAVDGAGNVSYSTNTVTVLDTNAPVFAANLLAATNIVLQGSNVIYTVALRHNCNPASYSWYFNSTNRLPGSVFPFLELTNLQPSQSGHYSVAASNRNGTITSAVTTLVINQLPVPASPVLARFPLSGVKARTTNLLGTDPDGDPLALLSLDPATALGGGVRSFGNWTVYTPPIGKTNEDNFTFTVSDGRGGVASGTITVQTTQGVGQTANFTTQELGNNRRRIRFDGIPGITYFVQYTESLISPNWETVTNFTADAMGNFEMIENTSIGAPTRVYRTVESP